ncbi:MAG TPA: Rrf2 family transcriptional regulator [Candidatus Blautia avicola]|uniref:Rrf2 family transcriptional regulator n=1 Tax=Candidatus Blautia avicola TaxID=2838483 RepID=A0A9D2QWY5_9FIRM|nr:Rrf2 family transcriptional regulator [Candidatus Blautia avicola]
MKLSTKGRYGLRALIDLAQYGEQEAVSIQSISARQQISDSYLEQLVRKLKKAGLVTSVRGAQGGYRLARPAEEISVGDVLRALEGSIEAVSCQEGENPSCVGKDLCVARYVWQKVNKSIQETVDSIMISQLVEESRRIQENQR